MPARLEIALKPGIPDAEGEGLRRKARDYFGLRIDSIRTASVLTIDAALGLAQLEEIRQKIFTNPVTQISSYRPLEIDFDWALWVGYRPGVRDTRGATAVEAVEDVLKLKFRPGDTVYTSKLYFLKGGGLGREDARRFAGELLANEVIQQYRVIARDEWDREEGVGIVVPKVRLEHAPSVATIPIGSAEELRRVSGQRNLFLNPNDIPAIRDYFSREDVRAERAAVGLADPTDVELEYIAQARSDHCNHNTFRGLFRYIDLSTGERRIVDSLFRTCIENPTLEIAKRKPWVVSVLWDNSGVGRFDDDWNYVITGETHNSPSNMEAYGGSLTGIVGVYRDPMGTGLGSRLILGTYGFCVGPRDYSGELRPRLHPRRLLDGVIEGVRDGGNKHGVPTPFGLVHFDECYLGKCLVFVAAMGIMPARIRGKPSDAKTTEDGDWIVMAGGRVGKDGIHGVTAASEAFSETTPAGHVQIGDPYTQKKMHDFLVEARDEGLVKFITDNGGGGLSSSIGESARYSNGAEVHLDLVPLKYEGLDPWEIWVSESQERMTIAVEPANLDRFQALARKHDVEATVVGTYRSSGFLHLLHGGKTCAYMRMDLLKSGFPQWEFDAEWVPPEMRGLREPVLGEPADHAGLLAEMLGRPNLASHEWIVRQYDHEVQGGSVVKPLVGRGRDTPSDAVVVRPILSSLRGIVVTQTLNPDFSRIDAYAMTAATIDEAVRRILAVGGSLDHIGGVDNFCWPSIGYDPAGNPDGKFKAAQLVRANWALRDLCLAYEIPLLSGKDSMYIDGSIPGRYGETHRISGLETIQFTACGVVEDVRRCVTMDAKVAGDLVYVLGVTRNELGGSELYRRFGATGLNVPRVNPAALLPLYRALERAIAAGIVASARGVYRGGLAVHLAMVAFAGDIGMEVDLARIPAEGADRDSTLLYSESAGRFIVTIAPADRERFEKILAGEPFARAGTVTQTPAFRVKGLGGKAIIETDVLALKAAWKRPFGDLV